MKLDWRTSIRLLLIALLLGSCVLAAADELTVNYVPRVLQSFDPDEKGRETYRTWQLRPSRFGYDAKGVSLWESKLVTGWPESLYGKNRDKDNLQILGMHGSFQRKGYNYVEIVPGTGEGSNFKPKPLVVPGRADAIDVWVWGSNHAYNLEIHVRDFNGIDHVLPLGLLQFTGWKNLRVRVPGNIPQVWKYVPRLRNLEITKLVLWTTPGEKVDDFYMYLDEIKVVSDVFETRFDGDTLAEVEALQKIWGTGTN